MPGRGARQAVLLGLIMNKEETVALVLLYKISWHMASRYRSIFKGWWESSASSYREEYSG